MSFAAIDPKFLILIDNYTSHDKQIFLERDTQPLNQANCVNLYSLFYHFSSYPPSSTPYLPY